LAVFTTFNILANNFLPLNVALAGNHLFKLNMWLAWHFTPKDWRLFPFLCCGKFYLLIDWQAFFVIVYQSWFGG
jgi:hypothetical protein